MDRRDWLKHTLCGAGMAAFSAGMWGRMGGSLIAAETAPAETSRTAEENSARSKTAGVKITDVKTFLTAPAGTRLVVVKVETNQPGLYGLGCATFTQRARAVETAVNHFLRPFLIGKNPFQVEDVWQSSFVSSYWRNGPVLNNGLSGVDMALWDILGKTAGLPVYQLLGGKVRDAVDTYRHASGETFEEVEKQARQYMAEGHRYVRCQVEVPGLATYGARRKTGDASPANQQQTGVWEPGPYVRRAPKLFEHMRRQLGDDVELLHDIHERVPPILAMQLVRDLEPYRLFFIEDPFSPEDVGYFEHLRKLTTAPLAMGELFNNPNEWIGLVSGRLIDFIRVHISQVGGLSVARKMAAMCEFFGVRTAWHGPSDVSPVGHAANVHLDLTVPNFGIQEARAFTQEEQDVFPGCPELKNGYFTVSDRPGLGVELDERLAAKFPIQDDPPFDLHWGNTRRQDGTVVKP